jgi:putative ABC transport system permease protein
MPLAVAQEMLGVGAKVNHFVMRLDQLHTADETRYELGSKLKSAGLPLQVLTWQDVDHEIVAIQRFQDGILDIVLFIIFVIVALGILNTLLMSLFERVREFGVLMAIGARPGWVMRLVLIESVLLGSIGMLFGVAIGSAMIIYFGKAGLALPIGDAMSYFIPFPKVIYLHYAWKSHLFAAASILFTSVVAAIPPALRACHLKPAEALRHV